MARVPRVALWPSAFFPHIGGVEELSRQLGLQLAARGQPPLVLTNRYPTDLPRTDEVDGLRVVRERFSVPLPAARPLVGFVLHTATTRLRLRRALDHYRPEVLHVQCVSFQSKYVLLERRRTGLPLVVSLQGELTMDAQDVYARTPLLRRLWRELLHEAEVVTACSQYVLDEAQDALGSSLQAKGRVVPNGVDLAETLDVEPHPHPRRYVLGLGRLVPQKGFDLLLRAFAEVAERLPDVDLLLAGGGPEQDALTALRDELGLDGRAHLVGPQPHAAALSLFRGADLFVMPSRHEPQGIVVLEAMAVGTPVLAAAVGGVPEVVHDGRNGHLFRGGEASHLAERLVELLSSPATTVTAARDSTHDFDWPVVTDAYLDCYAAATARRSA